MIAPIISDGDTMDAPRERDSHRHGSGDGAPSPAARRRLDAVSPDYVAPTPTPVAEAVRDVQRGIALWRTWLLFAWRSVNARFGQARLGMIWISISFGVLIGMLGLLYAHLFREDVAFFVPYVAAGFIAWRFIAGAITEGCAAFLQGARTILRMPLPYSVHVLQAVAVNLINLAYIVPVYVVIMLIVWRAPGWAIAFLPLSLAVLAVNAVLIGLILAPVSLRFRDVPRFLASAVQLLFFLTPIVWHPRLVPARALFVEANPFHHFVELFRAPLIGALPGITSLAVIGAITIFNLVAATIIFARCRSRIPYWL